MKRPVLFLDFDDVVNLFGSRTAHRKNRSALGYLRKVDMYVGGRFYSVNWSSELVRKLNAAKDKYGFEWLWLTTWVDNAPRYVDFHLGTRSDGFVDWDVDGGIALSASTAVVENVRSNRKYAALLDNLRANPRPFVWVDDSATAKYNPDDFVGDLDVPHLVVTPDARYGIDANDLSRVLEFLGSLGD